MKATFFDRLLAYIVDFIILGLLLGIIGYNLPDNSKEYSQKLEESTNKYLDKEINEQEYLNDYNTILYENNKSNSLKLTISTFLIVGYFVIFQYMNKGQTIGKKILKIRVVDKDTKKPISILKGMLRSLFTLNIFSGIIGLVSLYTLNKRNYFICYGIISILESLFIFITILFVLYRKDGRGIHDMMVNTIVIKEGR